MVRFNTSGFPDIPAGKAFYISWVEATGPVALTLLKVPYNAEAVPQVLGDAGQMIENNTVIRIASSLNGSPYRWLLAQAWGGYGQIFEMVIDDGNSYEYSGEFKVVSPVSMTSFMSSGSSKTALPTRAGGESSLNTISTSVFSKSLSLESTPSSTPLPTTNLVAETSLPEPTILPSGLSSGAKAGFGVGTVAGVALLAGLVALIFFFLKRKSRKAKLEITQTGSGNGQEHGKAELSAVPLKNAKIGEMDTHLGTTWTYSWRNTNFTANERSELVGSTNERSELGDNSSWRMSELEGSVVRGHHRMASSDSMGSVRSELEGSPVRGHSRVVSHESVVSSLAASPRIGSSGLRRSELSHVGMGIDDAEIVER